MKEEGVSATSQTVISIWIYSTKALFKHLYRLRNGQHVSIARSLFGLLDEAHPTCLAWKGAWIKRNGTHLCYQAVETVGFQPPRKCEKVEPALIIADMAGAITRLACCKFASRL